MTINDPVPTAHNTMNAVSRQIRPPRLRRMGFRLLSSSACQCRSPVSLAVPDHGEGGAGSEAVGAGSCAPDVSGAGSGGGGGITACAGAGGTPGYSGVPSGPYCGAP